MDGDGGNHHGGMRNTLLIPKRPLDVVLVLPVAQPPRHPGESLAQASPGIAGGSSHEKLRIGMDPEPTQEIGCSWSCFIPGEKKEPIYQQPWPQAIVSSTTPNIFLCSCFRSRKWEANPHESWTSFQQYHLMQLQKSSTSEPPSHA